MNGDTGANYDTEYMTASAAAVSSAELLAGTFITLGDIDGGTAAAGLAGSGVISIPNYVGTTFNKNVLVQSVRKYGTASTNILVRSTGAQWRSTAAITSLTIFCANANMAIGTTVTLYGDL